MTPAQLMERGVNLTPHDLIVHTEGGEIVFLGPSGTVARLEESTLVTGWGGPLTPDGVSVHMTEYRGCSGLPEQTDPNGPIYIVSLPVAQWVAANASHLLPNIVGPGPLIRDKGGRPVGCRGLRQVLSGS